MSAEDRAAGSPAPLATSDPDPGPPPAGHPGPRPAPGSAAAIESESVRGFFARAIPLVLVGFLLGGWLGALGAAAGVASTFRRPTFLVTAGAVAMLVVAALATVIEVPADDEALRSSYALDRPVASAAGLLAALFALVSVVTLAIRDRARPTAAEDAATPSHPGPSRSRGSVAAAVRRLGPVVAVVAITGVAVALTAPAPPEATQDVARSVRLGVGWGVADDEGVVALDGAQPPLPVVVEAAAPGGAALWTGLAAAGAAALVGALVLRRRSGTVAALAAAGVGLGLVVVRADLAAALVALCLASCALFADPDGRTVGRAAVAGAFFGAASLASPALALLLPLVVAVLVIDIRGRTVTVTVGHGVAGLVAALVVIAPWQRWLVERFDTWLPATDLDLRPTVVASILLVVGVVVVAHVVGRTPPPADAVAPA